MAAIPEKLFRFRQAARQNPRFDVIADPLPDR